MTDIPQELVDRVAEAFWNEGYGVGKYTVKEVIAAILDGVTLEWRVAPKRHFISTAETEFGTYAVTRCSWFVVDEPQLYPADDPKAAALADYRARVLKAMIGGS